MTAAGRTPRSTEIKPLRGHHTLIRCPPGSWRGWATGDLGAYRAPLDDVMTCVMCANSKPGDASYWNSDGSWRAPGSGVSLHAGRGGLTRACRTHTPAAGQMESHAAKLPSNSQYPPHVYDVSGMPNGPLILLGTRCHIVHKSLMQRVPAG